MSRTWTPTSRTPRRPAHVAELEDTFYGDRTYRVSDLEGHHWMFAERIADIPPQEWNFTGSNG